MDSSITDFLCRRFHLGSAFPINRLLIAIAGFVAFQHPIYCYADQQLLVPQNWEPSLESVEEVVKIEGNRPQQELNRASQQLADLRDAQLFILYVRFAAALDNAKRTALVIEQSAWLRKRGAKARHAVQSKGGSLAAAEYSNTFRELTEQRIKQLAMRLEAYKPKATPNKKP